MIKEGLDHKNSLFVMFYVFSVNKRLTLFHIDQKAFGEHGDSDSVIFGFVNLLRPKTKELGLWK